MTEVEVRKAMNVLPGCLDLGKGIGEIISWEDIRRAGFDTCIKITPPSSEEKKEQTNKTFCK